MIRTAVHEPSVLWPPPRGWPKNFKRHEWDCYDKHGTIGPKGALVAKVPTSGPIHEAVRLTAWNCQNVRDELCRIYQRDVSMTVISGYRPKHYNGPVGGTKNSQHLYGRAADLVAAGVPTKKFYQIILQMIREGRIDQGGVGYYPRSRFVHYDPRCVYGMRFARWRQKAKK